MAGSNEALLGMAGELDVLLRSLAVPVDVYRGEGPGSLAVSVAHASWLRAAEEKRRALMDEVQRAVEAVARGELEKARQKWRELDDRVVKAGKLTMREWGHLAAVAKQGARAEAEAEALAYGQGDDPLPQPDHVVSVVGGINPAPPAEAP